MKHVDGPKPDEGTRATGGGHEWSKPELVRFRPGDSESPVLPGVSGVPIS